MSPSLLCLLSPLLLPLLATTGNSISLSIIMVICNDKKYNPDAEDKYDIELNELAVEYSTLPDALATIKDRKPSQDSSLDSIKGIKELTKDPTPIPFPPPPQFCNGLSGGQIQLVCSSNTKLKILLVMASVSIISSIAFGVLSISLYYGKKAETTNPDDPACDNLVAKLELSLKAIADLSQALANFTRLPQDSTSNSDNAVDESWISSPKYSWA